MEEEQEEGEPERSGSRQKSPKTMVPDIVMEIRVVGGAK
jgi:hypothetical protein